MTRPGKTISLTPGKRILFLEKTYGDVYEVTLADGIIRPMTHHYYHEGYTRALYLNNGDILLSGARTFDARNPHASRSGKNAELPTYRSLSKHWGSQCIQRSPFSRS